MTQARRLWLQAPIALFGAALVTIGSFRVSLVEPFSGAALVVFTMLALCLASVAGSSTLRPTLRAACCLLVLVTATASGVTLGSRLAATAVRDEIPLLLRQVDARPNAQVPDLFDVHGSKYFRRTSLSAGPGGVGVRVRFGLPDGTVIEYVSNAHAWPRERTRQCTREIQPGWYRRSRCS